MNKIIKTTIVSAILAAFAAGTAFAREADFPSEPPTKINVKAVKNADFVLAAAFDTPILPDKEEPTDIEIMGAGEATEEQMAEYIKKRNKNPKLNCTVKDIVRYYYIEAGREGIRPDIALCQALKETGVFGYGGDVSPKQNNFCGLGATGNKEPGASFATPQLGVRAHIQHLMAYNTTKKPTLDIVDPTALIDDLYLQFAFAAVGGTQAHHSAPAAIAVDDGVGHCLRHGGLDVRQLFHRWVQGQHEATDRQTRKGFVFGPRYKIQAHFIDHTHVYAPFRHASRSTSW